MGTWEALGLRSIKETWGIAGNEPPGAGHEGSGTKLLAQPRTRHQPPKRCTHAVPKETRALLPLPMPGLSEQRTEHLRSHQPFLLLSGKEENKLVYSCTLTGSSGTPAPRVGWEKSPPNRGSFPGGVRRGRSRQPGEPHALLTPGTRHGRSLELHAHHRECRIVRAHGSCARGWKVARVFLLKFKTCCTQRAELTKGKLTLKKEKAQCRVTFLCPLWLKNRF